MTCQDFIDFLMDYVDGVLPAGQLTRFEEHLSVCPDCVNYLMSYRATTVLGKSAFSSASEPVPPEVPAELVQAILSTRGRAN